MQNSSVVKIGTTLRKAGFSGDSQDPGALLLTGYIVPLRSLATTCGTGFREVLTRAYDLVVGDEMKLRQAFSSTSVCFDDQGAQGILVYFTLTDVGTRIMTTQMARAVTMMSEFGQVIHARIVHDSTCFDGEALLLLEECLDPSVEYTLIAASHLEPGADLLANHRSNQIGFESFSSGPAKADFGRAESNQ